MLFSLRASGAKTDGLPLICHYRGLEMTKAQWLGLGVLINKVNSWSG